MSKLFVSDYISKFSCIGSKCEDNCCGKWTVLVDKKSYEYYEKLEREGIVDFLQFTEKNNASKHEYNYATLKMDPDKMCPLLTEEGLCQIHRDYGFDALCDTCKHYPKIIRKMNDAYYQTGYLSCPEMARVVLLSKSLTEWKLVMTEKPINQILTDEITVNRNYMKNMHRNIKDIFEQQHLSLSQRIWLIGRFIGQLHTAIRNKKGTNKAIALAEKEVKRRMKEEVSHFIEAKMSIMLPGIIKIGNSFSPKDIQQHITARRLYECVDLFKEGMQIQSKDKVIVKEFASMYRKKRDAFYQPFFAEHEYILENYCWHYFQHEIFPYHATNLAKKYLLFMIGFSILKLFLVGISASSSGLNEQIIVQLFQTYSKWLTHDEEVYAEYIVTIHDQLYERTQDFYEMANILTSE
ncbi:TPA: flagellin lysine-N-methylase [Bacillus toyonensis]|nr:flagellin lysine-N-methylase [Bacillus toyonensis]